MVDEIRLNNIMLESLNVSLEAHSRLLHYLKQHKDEIWTASMIEAVKNIRQNRQP